MHQIHPAYTCCCCKQFSPSCASLEAQCGEIQLLYRLLHQFFCSVEERNLKNGEKNLRPGEKLLIFAFSPGLKFLISSVYAECVVQSLFLLIIMLQLCSSLSLPTVYIYMFMQRPLTASFKYNSSFNIHLLYNKKQLTLENMFAQLSLHVSSATGRQC